MENTKLLVSQAMYTDGRDREAYLEYVSKMKTVVFVAKNDPQLLNTKIVGNPQGAVITEEDFTYLGVSTKGEFNRFKRTYEYDPDLDRDSYWEYMFFMDTPWDIDSIIRPSESESPVYGGYGGHTIILVPYYARTECMAGRLKLEDMPMVGIQNCKIISYYGRDRQIVRIRTNCLDDIIGFNMVTKK